MKRALVFAVLAGLLMGTGSAFAQARRGPPPGERGEGRGFGRLLENVPPEKRQEILERLRNGTPEEREQIRKRLMAAAENAPKREAREKAARPEPRKQAPRGEHGRRPDPAGSFWEKIPQERRKQLQERLKNATPEDRARFMKMLKQRMSQAQPGRQRGQPRARGRMPQRGRQMQRGPQHDRPMARRMMQQRGPQRGMREHGRHQSQWGNDRAKLMKKAMKRRAKMMNRGGGRGQMPARQMMKGRQMQRRGPSGMQHRGGGFPQRGPGGMQHRGGGFPQRGPGGMQHRGGGFPQRGPGGIQHRGGGFPQRGPGGMQHRGDGSERRGPGGMRQRGGERGRGGACPHCGGRPQFPGRGGGAQ